MTENSSDQDFIHKVENGDKTVYQDAASSKELKTLVPLIVFSVFAIILELALLLNGYDLSGGLFEIIVFGPVGIGAVLTVLLVIRYRKEESLTGMSGINRTFISQAIHFLDMILQGQAEIGTIVDRPIPKEHAMTSTLAFGATSIVLKKLDPEIAESWSSTLKEKLTPEVPLGTKLFIKITVYGTLLGLPIVIVLVILRWIGLINQILFLNMTILAFATVLILVIMILVYVFKNYGKDPPEGVLLALSEPQIRMDTERALAKIIETYLREGIGPLRVLVMGDYDEFIYTSRIYRTTKDYELKAAALLPNP